MLFHELLKYLRVTREIGLREFAHTIKMDVGNYSKIERGILNPPKQDVLDKVAKALGLRKEDKQKLSDLASQAVGKMPDDVVDSMKEYEYLPVLLRTIANKQLTDEQLKELTERVNNKY